MDGLRFDAWTRRRLGLAAGGLAASALGLTALEAAGKKKRKKGKKKRRPTCRQLSETCSTTGSGPTCCGTLNCDIVGATGFRCCLGLRNPCDPANNRCCSHLVCLGSTLSPAPICCARRGDPCERDGDCCAETGVIPCVAGACSPQS